MDGLVIAYVVIATCLAMYAVAATFGWLVTVGLIVGAALCVGLIFLEDIS